MKKIFVFITIGLFSCNTNNTIISHVDNGYPVYMSELYKRECERLEREATTIKLKGMHSADSILLSVQN